MFEMVYDKELLSELVAEIARRCYGKYVK